MDKWLGSAAVCVVDGKVLMVKQGKPEERKQWSIPSGGKEPDETYEECCCREVFEETGYQIKVVNHLFEKTGKTFGISVHVHYFEAKIVGGKPVIQDPDGLIYEIAWKSIDDLKTLDMSFPEDRQFLIDFIKGKKKHLAK
jgi:8-oxo-dGTP pyrophosphatase MutT (NUDIX family)